MAHSLKDPLLIQAKDAVETKLPDALKEPVAKIVIAGMKILYSPKSHQEIVSQVYDGIAKNGFQPQHFAISIVNLVGLVYKASKGAMPVAAGYPACVILLCYLMDDLEQLKGFKPTADMLKQTGSVMMQAYAKVFKLKDASQPDAMGHQLGNQAAQPGAPNPASAPPPSGMAQQPVAQGAA
jgi:hypothetical protein